MGKNRTRGLVKVSPTFIDRTKCSDPRVRIKFGGASGAKGPSCPEGGQWLFGQGLRSSTCLIHGPLFAELLAGDSNIFRARTKVSSTFRHSMDWMKSGKFRKKNGKILRNNINNHAPRWAHLSCRNCHEFLGSEDISSAFMTNKCSKYLPTNGLEIVPFNIFFFFFALFSCLRLFLQFFCNARTQLRIRRHGKNTKCSEFYNRK